MTTSSTTYLAEDWKEFLDCEFLLSTLLGGAHLFAQIHGWVAVQGSQDVWDVIGIDLACAVAVIDAESEFCVCWGENFVFDYFLSKLAGSHLIGTFCVCVESFTLNFNFHFT